MRYPCLFLLFASLAQAQCPTPDPNVPVGMSHRNPADFGAEVVFDFSDFSTSPEVDYKARVSATGALRGQPAMDALLERFGCCVTPPPDGLEYLLVRVRFSLDCGPAADETFRIHWNTHTRLFSSSFSDYPRAPAEAPLPSLDFAVYPGGSGEGWGAYLVAVGDPCPLLAVGRDQDGSRGAWLRIPQGHRAGDRSGALTALVLIAAALYRVR